MIPNYRRSILIGLVLGLSLVALLGCAEDRVCFDVRTGEYVVTYKDDHTGAYWKQRRTVDGNLQKLECPTTRDVDFYAREVE